MKIKTQDIVEIWENNPNKTIEERTKIYNDKFGTQFASRTLAERYRNYKEGFREGMKNSSSDEELSRIAQKEFKILQQQKLNTMIKSEAHKVAKETAIAETIIETFKEHIGQEPKVSFSTYRHKPLSAKVIDIVIADIQYAGDEEQWVADIFSRIFDEVKKFRGENLDIRLVFLGDDVENQMSHVSQLLENKRGVIKQVTELAQLLIKGIKELVKFIDFSHNFSVVFVPFSNHGMIGAAGKNKYKLPNDDLGLVLLEMLKIGLPDVYFHEPCFDTFAVRLDDTDYAHGHQFYLKNKQRLHEVLGCDKDLFLGHLHHYEEVQERNRVKYMFGTACKHWPNYAKLAGFKQVPEIAIVYRKKIKGKFTDRLVKRINLEVE